MLLILQLLNMDIQTLKFNDKVYMNGKVITLTVKAFYAMIHSFEGYEPDPIPLSVEWLKKAGYKQLKRVEKTYSLGNFEDNSAIYFTGVRFIHIKTNVHIEFLHELQQLHSVLFKEELKFNL